MLNTAGTEWFEQTVRPDVVVSRLTSQVADFGTDRLVLLGCRITRIRSAPTEGSWTATYEFDVRDPTSGLERTVVTTGSLLPPGVQLPPPSAEVPFGAEGWSCAIPDLRLHLRTLAFDDALPGLSALTDPDRAPALLQRLLPTPETGAPVDTPNGWDVRVLSHKPGVRATVVCRLDDRIGSHPFKSTAVLVKVYNDDAGRTAHDVGLALSAAGLGSPGPLRIPEPIAYDPGTSMSVQQYVDDATSLKELFHRAFVDGASAGWADLVQATTATAAALAILHRCGCAYGPDVTFADELATVAKKHAKLAAATGTGGEQVDAAMSQVRSAAAAAPEDPLGPAHHSFRPAQVLLRDGQVWFIDFDKFCQAEPAHDVASLTTKLLHMGVNKVGDADPRQRADRERRLAELRTAFLDEYRRHAPLSDARLVLWETLELVSLVLSAAKKADRARVDSCRLMLARHLEQYGL